MCCGGRKRSLTVDTALGPILWAGLYATVFLQKNKTSLSTKHLCTLHSHESHVGGCARSVQKVLEETAQCGNQKKVTQKLSGSKAHLETHMTEDGGAEVRDKVNSVK